MIEARKTKPPRDTGHSRARNRGAANPGLKSPSRGLILALCLFLAWPAPCGAGNGPGYSVQIITLTQPDRATRHYAELRRILPLEIRDQLRVELINGYHVIRLGWASRREDLAPLLAEAARHCDAPAIKRARLDPSRVVFPVRSAPVESTQDGEAAEATTPADPAGAVADETALARDAAVQAPLSRDAITRDAATAPPHSPAVRADTTARTTDLLLKKLDLAPWQWAGIGLAGLLLIISFIGQIIKRGRKNPAAPRPAEEDARTATKPEAEISDSAPPVPEEAGDDDSEACETGTCAASGTPALSPAREAALRSNLGQMSMARGNIMGAKKEARTIYVTSCFNGEGKTRASVHLAHALSIDDCRVLLVDANPRAPSLHEIYGVDRDPGFMDCVFSGNGQDPICARPTKYKNLHLMTFGSAGKTRPNLLEGDKLKNTLAAMREKYDFVVVDGHSLLASSDTPLVASLFDGVVLVAECEKTKWEVAQQARDKCVMLGGHVLGVILNKRKFYIPRFFYGR